MKNNVVVIGSGASGMIAAIAAARNGHVVKIIERTGKSGKKILMTGNGRCNLTNEKISIENYHTEDELKRTRPPKFVQSIFARFSNKDTLEFFEQLGLATITEEEGRVFPRSNQAQSVVDILRFELERLNVPIIYNKRVSEIEKNSSGFNIKCDTGKLYKADNIILATGGKSYEMTGSSGDGYELAKKLTHTIITPTEASVPFRVKSLLSQQLQGVKPEVEISVFQGNKLLASNKGTIMFAHFGLSGPAIMQISRIVGKYFTGNNTPLNLRINFFPEYSKPEVDVLLIKRFTDQPNRTLNKSFVGLLISKIAPAIFDIHNIDGETIVSKVDKNLRKKIVDLLTEYPEELLGTMGWNLAQFTAGGIALKEINSQTMESKIVPGLYFCGEVVDIDGDSGGYNLQWAWSSGWVAGNAI